LNSIAAATARREKCEYGEKTSKQQSLRKLHLAPLGFLAFRARSNLVYGHRRARATAHTVKTSRDALAVN
jgi:hypothetical protein